MSEELDDATEATFTEEEFINPLDGLIERTKTDPTAPFEAAEALAELKQTDPIAYQKLRARLIGAGFRAITALEDILKNLIREKQHEQGGAGEDSQVAVLMAALKGVYLYHSADDTAYADVMIDGHRETYPVKSGQFKKYLRRQYFLSNEKRPAGGGVEHRHRHRRGAGGLLAPINTRSTSVSQTSATASFSTSATRRTALSRSRRMAGTFSTCRRTTCAFGARAG